MTRLSIGKCLLLGLLAECVLAAPLFFMENGAETAPLLNWLQAPGATPVLRLIRDRDVRRFVKRVPTRSVVLMAQAIAITIQTVLIGVMLLLMNRLWLAARGQ